MRTPAPRTWDSVSHPLDTGWVFLYNDAKWGNVKYRARAGVCCLEIAVTAAVYAKPATAIVMATPEGQFNLLARDNTVPTGQNVDGTLTYMAR